MQPDTDLLFKLLLRYLSPDITCDVGAFDGQHAKRFQQLLPDARVMAFEANPRHVLWMRTDRAIIDAQIEVVHKAVWNRSGTVSFYIEETSERETWRDAISSTRQRHANSLGATKIQVEAVRLDEFLQENEHAQTVALWIDVEGAAFEVLQGIEQVRERVVLVHAEVETHPFWRGQKLKPEIQALMERNGFVELARGPGEAQHDLVFVNERIYRARTLRLKFIVFWAALRFALQRTAGTIYRTTINAWQKVLRRRGRV